MKAVGVQVDDLIFARKRAGEPFDYRKLNPLLMQLSGTCAIILACSVGCFRSFRYS